MSKSTSMCVRGKQHNIESERVRERKSLESRHVSKGFSDYFRWMNV